jgi:predicted dehydrogenase
MKVNEKVLSIGVLGAGGIVENLHLPVLLNRTDARVAWVADKDAARAKSVAQAFGIDRLALPDDLSKIPEVDVLLVAIPYGVREPYYQALKGRAVNFYVEKPFANCVAEHQRLVSWFPGGRLACGFQRRSWTAVEAFAQILREPFFGAIRRVRLGHGYRGRLGASRYAGNPRMGGGGILMEAGIHMLDLALYTLEATAIIEAHGKQLREYGFDVHTQARLLLRTRQLGEFPVDIVISGLVNTEHQIAVEYENAELSFAENNGWIQIRAPGSAESYPLFATNPGPEPSLQQCHAHWSAFFQFVRDGRPNRTSVATSLLTTEAVERLYAMADE